MDSAYQKSTDQRRLEYLVNNFGYILLQLLLLILKVTVVVVYVIAKILHLPTICTFLWAWLYPTRVATKTRRACRLVSQHVSPLCAVTVVGSLCSLPIVIGATLEQNGPEIEQLKLQLTAIAKTCVPAFSFFVGILLTYIVLRLLPGYDETCSSINQNLHAPTSVLELLDHQIVPGEFPIVPSWRMIDEIKDMLSAKDQQIASLRHNLEQEDQEIIDLMAQKDEEISQYQTTLQQRDRKITDLQKVKAPLTQRPASTTFHLPPPPTDPAPLGQRPASTTFHLPPPPTDPAPLAQRPASTTFHLPPPPTDPAATEQTRKLEKQFKAALAAKAELERQIASWMKQTDVLKKENSELRMRRSGPALINPRNSVFKECRKQILSLEKQLSQRDLDAASAQESTIAQYDQRIRGLEAQLSQRNLEAAKAGQSITDQYDQRVRDLEGQLARCDVEAAKAQQLANDRYRQQVSELEVALLHRTQDASTAHQSILQLTLQVQDLETQLSKAQHAGRYLEEQLSQNQVALSEAIRKDDERAERLTYLEDQCVKANHLYKQYVDLLAAYNKLLAQPGPERVQGQADSSEGELHLAREHNAKLVRANEQLKKALQDSNQANPLVEIALSDKDKEIERVREAMALMQENFNSVRRDGEPSSAFLKKHSALSKDRDALQAKIRRLEAKLFPLEIRAATLQKREQTLSHQLKQHGYPIPDSTSQETPIALTGLAEMRDERDNAVQAKADLEEEAHQALSAVVSSVGWQLEGRTEEETVQKCAALGDVLGPHVRPVLDEIRWKLEALVQGAKREQDHLQLKMDLQKMALQPSEPPSAPPTGITGKRKGVEPKDEEESEERGGKRLHQE